MNRTATLEQIARLATSLTEASAVAVWAGEDRFCLGTSSIDIPLDALRTGLEVDGWQVFSLEPESGASSATKGRLLQIDSGGLAVHCKFPLADSTAQSLRELTGLAGYALTTEQELRQLHRAELLESRSLTDGLQAIVVITNAEGCVLDINRSGLATLPERCEFPIGMRLEHTPWFDHDPTVRDDLRQALDFCTSAEAVRFDTTLRLDDSLIPMDLSLMPLTDLDHSVTHIVCSATDITVRKQIEEHLLDSQAELQQSLQEKETLLREVHHRVKNNLQVISSLLGLQARRLTDQSVRAVLDESRERVRAMSMVHEKLYQAKDISELNAAEYLGSLVGSLRSAYSGEAKNIATRIECDPITLGADQAIPLGLIVNELVSNSFKHAFVGRPSGSLLVRLQEHPPTDNVESPQLTLRVADDGIGLENGIDMTPRETLGLRLIGMLTEQLNGKLVIDGMGGTSFELTFFR